jgi:hypothetical protein
MLKMEDQIPFILMMSIFSYKMMLIWMKVENNLNLIVNNLNWKILTLNLRKLMLLILTMGRLVKQKAEVEVVRDDIDLIVQIRSALLKNTRRSGLRATNFNRSLQV